MRQSAGGPRLRTRAGVADCAITRKALRSRQAGLPLAVKDCRNSSWVRGEELCPWRDGFLESISMRRSGNAGKRGEVGRKEKHWRTRREVAARPDSARCRQFKKVRYHLAEGGISTRDLRVWERRLRMVAGSLWRIELVFSLDEEEADDNKKSPTDCGGNT